MIEQLKGLAKFAEKPLATGILKIRGYETKMVFEKRIEVFGITVSKYFFSKTKRIIDIDAPVFYLKVNRIADYTLRCIQEWLNIVYEMKADFYFICDSDLLRHMILNTCRFQDGDIKFLKSMRKELKHTAKNLYTGHWKNATYAHLTPFYHAKNNGIKRFWNIDADDTMFLLEPQLVSKILKKVEMESDQKGIAANSLDIWRSKTFGVHWTLGILYINGMEDFCRIFEANRNLSWTREYEAVTDAFNLDWFMSSLAKKEDINIQSFYVDNAMFIHWGSFILNPFSASIFSWKDGKLVLPIQKNIFDDELGEVEIADCLKIDIGLSGKEGNVFWKNEVSVQRFFNSTQCRLFRSGNVNSQKLIPF